MNAAALALQTLRNVKFSHCVLSLSHADLKYWIGGTERVVREEQRQLLSQNVSYLHLFPADKNGARPPRLFGLRADGVFIGHFTVAQLSYFLPFLEKFGLTIAQIHMHHLLATGAEAAEDIIENLSAPVRFFIHDYFSACPGVNFLRNDEEYCEAPPPGSVLCNGCKHGSKRVSHFETMNQFFTRRAFEFITPSEVSAGEWLKTYPHFKDKLRVVPHLVEASQRPIARTRKENAPIKMAYLGYQARLKGTYLFNDFVDQFVGKKQKDYEFFHLGEATQRVAGVKYIPVSNLDNPNAMVDKLNELGIEVTFLWSLCPETFSFTLYESLAAGCFVVTSEKSGNIARVVKELSAGMVFASSEDFFQYFNNPGLVKKDLARYQATGLQRTFISNSQLASEVVHSLPERKALIAPSIVEVDEAAIRERTLYRQLYNATESRNLYNQKDDELREVRIHSQHLENQVRVLNKIRDSFLFKGFKALKQFFTQDPKVVPRLQEAKGDL